VPEKYCLKIFMAGLLAMALFSCTLRQPEEIDYAPGTPFNPYPPDSATNIDHTTLDVTLRWTATDPNSGDVLTYALYFDTLNPPVTQIASGLNSPGYFLTGLSYGTTYYWKLYITDDKGVTTNGPVWRFTTLPHANTAPGVPIYLYPFNNAAWQYPTLDFGSYGFDPEGDSDTLFYDLYLGVTPQPPLTLFKNDTSSSWTFTGLNYATTYYWKVMVRDNHYACTSGPVYSFATRDCPWFYKRDLPSPRYGFGTAVVNDKVYVIGGTNGADALAEVLEYSPLLDTWTGKTGMPTPRSNLAVTVWNGKIYAIGGKANDSLFGENEAYDPLLDSWSSLAPAPVAFSWATAHAIDGKIYLLGAKQTEMGIYTLLLEYGIATDSWQILSSLPHGNLGHCSAVCNGLIYVMGGATKLIPVLPFVDIYHPETNTWSSAGDVIGPANCMSAVTANGSIYALGGYDGSYSKRVRKYDPLSGAWQVRGDMQTGRSYFGAAFINNRIYAFGGITPFLLASVEEYWIELDPKNSRR
jgi:N-acetylneuraminic acid mutarotase